MWLLDFTSVAGSLGWVPTHLDSCPQQPVAPTELPLARSPNSALSFGTQIMYLSVQTHVLLMADKMLINFTDCSFLRQVRKLDPQLSVRALV